VHGVATADYRGYDLKDLLPLEYVFLPEIALPPEQHPCLLFTPEQIDHIRQRTLREPYAQWWRHVLRRAQAGLRKNLSDPRLEETTRAFAAKSCAFAYAVTGEISFLEKAREGLLHISPPPSVTSPEGGKRGQGWGDWVRASALMLIYCATYDLVAQDLSAEDRRIVVNRIAAETDQLYRNLKFAPLNNHRIVMAAAVGTAALTIPSYGSGQAQAWMDAAIDNLRSSLTQIEDDGSYREGVFYAGYISRILLPFALYLRTSTGEDLFRHRRFEDMIQWLLKIRKPDGTIPLFDDAWQENHAYLPLMVGQSRLGGVARWIYERGPQEPSDMLSEVEFICAFDDAVLAEPPPWERTAFFPDGGMAVFGDGWASDGIYLLLLGEEKKALASGHEHLDPGNFVLHAHGQNLIIDSGYGPQGRTSTNRPWLLSGEGHNMLLVDGRGPSGNPFSQDQLGGQLAHCFRHPRVSGAAVKAHYRGADIQRTVHFLGQRYFLVFDQVKSDQLHDYDLVLHGMGNAQRDGLEQVTWSAEGGKLQVEFLNPEKAPFEMSLRTGQHTPNFGGWETHTYLRATQPRQREAHFCTLLFPQRVEVDGVESVDLSVLTDGQARAREISGEDLKDARHLLVATDGRKATVGGVTTDGLVCVTGFGEDGQRQFFVNGQGTFYTHLGDTCWVSNRPVTVTMITARDRWAGYVDAGEEEVEVQIETGFDPGHVRFGEFPVDYEYSDGKVRLKLSGSGPLELGQGPPLIFTPKRTKDRYPFLDRLAQQEEPMARWEELSPEQRFLVETQALAMIDDRLAQEVRGLSQRMGLGPHGLGSGFGMVTGLADQAYDPENWARLNIPQHLQGRRTLGGSDFCYVQEGHVTGQGWRVERLEGQLSQGGWGSVALGQYSPFPEVIQRTLRLNLGKLSLGTGLERMKGKERYQFSTSYLQGAAIWGMDGYAQDGPDDYGLNFFWRGPMLTAEASQCRGTEGPRGRRFYLAHHGQTFSPQAELQDPGLNGEKELRVSWTSLPFRSITWELNSLLIRLSPDPLIREVGNRVSGQGKILSYQLHTLYREGVGSRGSAILIQRWSSCRWNLQASFRQDARPLVTEENLTFLWDWKEQLGSATSVSHRHRSPEGDDVIRLTLSAHVRPERKTRLHLKLEGGCPEKKMTVWGMGFDRWGSVAWGGQWTHFRPLEGRRRSQLSLHGGWMGAGWMRIRGRAELELNSDSQIEAYQIELQQEGTACSPGLLLSKDPLTGVRNDGFLRFRF
jgi:hypothetical protein